MMFIHIILSVILVPALEGTNPYLLSPYIIKHIRAIYLVSSRIIARVISCIDK